MVAAAPRASVSSSVKSRGPRRSVVSAFVTRSWPLVLSRVPPHLRWTPVPTRGRPATCSPAGPGRVLISRAVPPLSPWQQTQGSLWGQLCKCK